MKSKKIAIIFAVLAYAIAGYFIAEYLAGAIFFLISKSMPSDISLDTWWTYWDWYSDDVKIRKHLQAAAFISAALVYIAPIIIISSLMGKRRSLHGDARFATSAEVRQAGLLGEKGIIVGKLNGQYLLFGGQQFVALAAPTRSGKGVAVVVPNLLNYSDSVVVLDLKLENFKLTSGFRARHGQKVFLFSPFSETAETHCWNPLDGINRDKNFRIGDILSIGQALYPSNNEKDAFWAEQARNLFLGITLYLLDTPELPCTLGEALRQSSGKGMPTKDYLQTIINERTNSDSPLSDECLDALNRFLSTSDNTMSSILATFNGPLTIFTNTIVDAATSKSDFDITRVRKERMSIYVGIQPNKLSDAALLVNLFFSQLINLNTKELPQDNPALTYQCALFLDEFTALGRIGIISKAVSYIAGYNLRLVPIFQSIAQLESVYGQHDARTFLTNHALQIMYPPREQKDANEYSEMLGYFTEKSVSTGISGPRGMMFGNSTPTSSENTSDQRRALMLPQELKEMDQKKEIIVLENSKPILCDKARYYEDPVFIDRLKMISPTLASIGKRLPTQDELTTVAFVNHELSSSVPVQDIDLHRAKNENRTRFISEDETIDLNKLTTDLGELPEINDQENPSTEEVEALCDAFFGSIAWVDEESGEVHDSDDLKSQPFQFGDPVESKADEKHGLEIDESEDNEFSAGGYIEQAFTYVQEEISVQDNGPPDDEVPDDSFFDNLAPADNVDQIDLSLLDK